MYPDHLPREPVNLTNGYPNASVNEGGAICGLQIVAVML
jgi:hypothetical protein